METHQVIINLLNKIIQKLSGPDYRGIIFLIIGAVLGFLSSFLIYTIQERKRKKDKYDAYIVDLFSLIEEMRHNAAAIRIESYPLEYYTKEMNLMINAGTYQNQNNGVIQKTMITLESRLKDREILSARLAGKMAEHDIYFGENKAVNDAKLKLRSYDLTKSYFDDNISLKELREQYDSNFSNTIKVEVDETYSKLLFSLVDTIKDRINQKLINKINIFHERKK